MPRTRTKYIWPPPILANDTATPPPRADATTPTITNATTTTTSEPRAKKKPRIAGSRRTANSQRNTPAQEDREASRAGDDGNNQETREELVEWDPDSDTAPPSVEVVIAAYARIPMETQVKNYREWRRFGSVHEDFCMTCRKSGPESLIPCSTCSKSFHDHCLPQGSLYNERRQWFCAVCVHRNWHEQPPTLTPPASPSPEPSTEKGNPKKRSNAHLTDPEHTTTSNNSQALSILAEISRSMSRGETRHPNMPSQAHAVHRLPEISTPYSPNPSSITLPSISSRPEFGLPTPSASASAHGGSGSGSGSILDSHARKSKFATLSSEVDSALWVLYRELESVTSLRQRIGELESEIVKLRQDVSIRDNQLILSRRSMSVHGGNLPNGISQTEIDRLRVQAAKVEEVTRQAESIRARNEALEKELQDAKAESAAKDKTLNEWKGRLVSLIGN